MNKDVNGKYNDVNNNSTRTMTSIKTSKTRSMTSTMSMMSTKTSTTRSTT